MNRSSLLLVLLGLAAMAADIADLPKVRAVLSATGASPAPRVFSSVRGMETYSTRFFIDWKTDQASGSIELTPEGPRLDGPYNRRNVYGAVLAYGPVLIADPNTRPMFESVTRYAFCEAAPLLKELNIPAAATVQVRLEPLAGTDLGNMSTSFEVSCDPK
jgi:hypothetical protein